MHPLKRLSTLLFVLWVCLAAQPAQAHPADEGRQEVAFSLNSGALRWTHEFWLGPLIGLPTWAQVDRDGNGAVTDAEQLAFAQQLQSQVILQIDGNTIEPHLISIDVAPQARFVAQPAAPQIRVVFSSTIAAGTHTLRFQSNFNPERIKLMARFPSGGGVAVSGAQVKTNLFSAQLEIKPAALTLGRATPTPLPPSNETNITPLLPPAISGLIEGNVLTPGLLLFGLLASFGVGAAHALTPGHGKGIIAGYMIGDRGGWLHALILAVTMTVTHTSSVIIVGVLALVLSRGAMGLSPTMLVPWLTLISGLLVVVIGALLLWQRVKGYRPTRFLKPRRSIALDLHDELEPHTHERLTPHNLPRTATGRISWRALIVLGFSGGLLPCADALAILLLAISVNHVVLGLFLLMSFSLGIGLTLTLLGVIAAGGQRLLGRYNRLQTVLAWLPVVSAIVVIVLGVLLLWQAATAIWV